MPFRKSADRKGQRRNLFEYEVMKCPAFDRATFALPRLEET